MTELKAQMDSLRQWIAEENEKYQSAIARGDRQATAHHKKQLAGMRNQFNNVLKKSMQQQGI
jgi:hypothetical protein